MKSECCNADVKWINLVPFCLKCHKLCKIKGENKMSKTEFNLSGKIVEAKEVYDAVNKAKEGQIIQRIERRKLR